MKDERKSGAALAYIIIGANSLVGLCFTPFLLRCLGQAEYGLYQLIGSFVGYLAILDFGIASTITRYVAKYHEEGDTRGEENFLGMCFMIYTIMGLLIVMLGTLVFWQLDVIFGPSLTPSELSKAKIMFLILIVSIVATLFDRGFTGAISGYERFVIPRIVNIGRIVFKVLILVLLLLNEFGAIAIVVTDAVLNLIVLFVNSFYALNKVKIHIRLHQWDKKLAREIFSFSFFIFLSAVTAQLWFRLPQLILGIMTDTASVAVFAVAIQFNEMYMGLSCAISGVFLPRATQMVARGASGEELTDMMIGPSRYQLMLLGAILSGFLLFGRQFITLWAGVTYAQAYIIASIIMVPITIPLFQNLAISILQAKNKHSFRALLYLGIAVAGAAASIPLVRMYGTIGVAFGSASTFILGSIIIMNIYYHYVIGINIPRFFKEACHGILPSILLSGALGVVLSYIWADSWIKLITQCVLFIIGYSFILWSFGMNSREKRFFSSCTIIALNTFMSKNKIGELK
ncbi:predicted integral membrane protein involved in polysaccharide production [Desulfobacula toluolica Tol2]|uniref:Predicted integral membrane protein involved in polysaccharide production n=1 Tax=Desulfobacula toluolica (strain DSM 7467 / Tol2) TaxID=651182 RepID=K0NJB3_DESTT|nr:predicted integral membrane protein involved in polysaccharide production [Desulfobacula toluolica Tol2]